MGMDVISNIIIIPIKSILDIFFNFFVKFSNTGIAVIGLSFVVTVCCLPLYIMAEQWQEEERKIQKKLEHGVKLIKTAFKKDEQYMMLSTFYRENHYHPIMALRSSFSLLIQIPFFIAAYSYLSNLDALKGYSFLFIEDMGAPDKLFHIGSFFVNVLPIAMTLINCISGAVYSKGHAVREKVQIYGMAAIFLVLLYNSPAGLVLYWTMNNVLSLVKNIFYKMKQPLKVFYVLCSCFSVGVAIWAITTGNKLYMLFFTAFALVVLFMPLLIKGVDYFTVHMLYPLQEHKSTRAWLFVLSALVLAVTAGLAIPATIIESSSSDYFYIDQYISPAIFLFTAFFQSTGLLFFWPLCLYALFPQKAKTFLAFFWTCLAFWGILNCFAFSGDYGLMNIDFSLMDEAQPFILSHGKMIANILLSIAILLALLIGILKKSSFVNSTVVIILVALIGLSVKKIAIIHKNFKNATVPQTISTLYPIFHISKTGRNVIVFMEDRSVSAFMPEIFEEKPHLKEQFAGFTYYPNTVSFSHYTTLGAPGLFGGYDFTPWEVNKRTELSIREKHNQSLLTMPALFLRAGYDVTVTNLPYENYGMQPVEEVYADYPDIKRVRTQGAYSGYWYNDHNMQAPAQTSYLIKKNMLYFSLFKLVNPAFRVIVYGCGYRLTSTPYKDYAYLIDTYAPLDYLSELFAPDASGNTFTLFDNELPHAPAFLQAPDYIPAKNITDIGNGPYAQNPLYHVNMAMMIKIGSFCDYLRQEGCYDNTRIIIVSDHGDPLNSGKFDNISGLPMEKEVIQAVLFVKDFDSNEALHEDMRFMTNADTPSLALKDIMENPKNPFTGNSLSVEDKNAYMKIAVAPMQSLRTRDDKKFTVADNEWITVHDNIFISENWSRFIPEREGQQ
ncbi:MAG: membrane protein insertase YidC [Treponema sp.]|nr:membrane protein insertase YidC [Treponema sp.]